MALADRRPVMIEECSSVARHVEAGLQVTLLCVPDGEYGGTATTIDRTGSGVLLER